MKNLSVPNKLLYLINVVFVLLWFCAFISPYINPQSFSLGALLAIGYPILLLIHLLFILYWMVRFKKAIYLSLSVLILSYFFSVPVFQSKSKFKALAKDNSFSIMSFNSQLSYFSGGQKKEVQTHQSKIIKVTECWQQFTTTTMMEWRRRPHSMPIGVVVDHQGVQQRVRFQ